MISFLINRSLKGCVYYHFLDNPFVHVAGDGLIQEKELAHVMRACMDENGMKFDEGEVDELTR